VVQMVSSDARGQWKYMEGAAHWRDQCAGFVRAHRVRKVSWSLERSTDLPDPIGFVFS
jgi:hypothetical protein